jgi:aminomethyltransferase
VTVSGEESLEKTALHQLHVESGGRMVDFAGWHLPVQYSGVMEEHRAVRSKAGLFDVSHMGEVTVRGPQALDYLQHVTCNDVSRLAPGRAQYTALTTPEGGFVDDLLIYMLGEQD